MPQNARSLLVSPNVAPEHGLPAARVLRSRGAQALAGARSPTKVARDPDARVPRRRGAPVPGRPRRQRLRERVHGAVRRRGAQRQPRRARRGGAGRRRRRAHRPGHPRRARSRCRSTTRRSTSTPTARRRASSGVTRARRRADDARRDARQHQHARRLDRREQRPVVLRRHLLRRRAGRRHAARSARCPCASATEGSPVLLGAYGDVRRALGAVAVERNHLARVAHVLMQTEGRDLGSAADDARGGAARRTRARATSTSASSVRSS